VHLLATKLRASGRGRSRLASLAAAGALAAAGTLAAGLTACASQSGSHATPGLAAAPSASNATASPQPFTQAVRVASQPQHINAMAGVLANAATTRVLWSRDLDAAKPVGSIAKVLTALVVIRAGNLDRQVLIPKAVVSYVARYQGESAGLRPGDRLTVRQLLAAMLLQSACDAAYVLATTYGPGMPAFLAKMNAEARALGMAHSHFTSPDGLPYPTAFSSYSTPDDLLRLGSAAMAVPAFRQIVGLRFYQVHKVRHHNHAYWWGNTNALIGGYPGAEGIKTGYTDAAKHCLLFEATRRGTTLIGVVLGSPATSPFTADIAATRLLNWGFAVQPGPAATAAPSG
jgi:serine-type D-Ala-D-Ala carboxypeptidase (penicillin-binding protein 5/6)